MMFLCLSKDKRGAVTARKPVTNDGGRLSGGGIVAQWPADRKTKPDYRNKWVMYNCAKYRIIWDKRGDL